MLALVEFRNLINLGNAISACRFGASLFLPFTGRVLQSRIDACNLQISFEPARGHFRKRRCRLRS
jgi:hypothetical protein